MTHRISSELLEPGYKPKKVRLDDPHFLDKFATAALGLGPVPGLTTMSFTGVSTCVPNLTGMMSGVQEMLQKQFVQNMQVMRTMQTMQMMQVVSALQAIDGDEGDDGKKTKKAKKRAAAMQSLAEMQQLQSMQAMGAALAGMPDMQAVPDAQGMPGMQNMPGMQAAPATAMQALLGPEQAPIPQSLPELQLPPAPPVGPIATQAPQQPQTSVAANFSEAPKEAQSMADELRELLQAGNMSSSSTAAKSSEGVVSQQSEQKTPEVPSEVSEATRRNLAALRASIESGEITPATTLQALLGNSASEPPNQPQGALEVTTQSESAHVATHPAAVESTGGVPAVSEIQKAAIATEAAAALARAKSNISTAQVHANEASARAADTAAPPPPPPLPGVASMWHRDAKAGVSEGVPAAATGMTGLGPGADEHRAAVLIPEPVQRYLPSPIRKTTRSRSRKAHRSQSSSESQSRSSRSRSRKKKSKRSSSRGERKKKDKARGRSSRSRSRDVRQAREQKWKELNRKDPVKEPAPPESKPPNVPDWISDLVPKKDTGQSSDKVWFKALTIMASQVGHLIGPGGSGITSIRRATGADIKVDHGRGKMYGTVTITGNVEMAEKMIMDKLATGPTQNAPWAVG